jgi:hypothetical protein
MSQTYEQATALADQSRPRWSPTRIADLRPGAYVKITYKWLRSDSWEHRWHHDDYLGIFDGFISEDGQVYATVCEGIARGWRGRGHRRIMRYVNVDKIVESFEDQSGLDWGIEPFSPAN